MTERDSDIEFDFFDEPETEEASERVRTPRRPPPGKGYRRLPADGALSFLSPAVSTMKVSVGCWPPAAVPASVGSLVVIVRLGKCPSTSSGHLTVVPDGT